MRSGSRITTRWPSPLDLCGPADVAQYAQPSPCDTCREATESSTGPGHDGRHRGHVGSARPSHRRISRRLGIPGAGELVCGGTLVSCDLHPTQAARRWPECCGALRPAIRIPCVQTGGCGTGSDQFADWRVPSTTGLASPGSEHRELSIPQAAGVNRGRGASGSRALPPP